MPCDKGLVKQERKNNVSTMLALEPYEIVKKTGNKVIIESQGGTQLMRNMTHVKKYQVPFTDPEETRKASSQVLPKLTRVRKLLHYYLNLNCSLSVAVKL